jgi:hypothetical protein
VDVVAHALLGGTEHLRRVFLEFLGDTGEEDVARLLGSHGRDAFQFGLERAARLLDLDLLLLDLALAALDFALAHVQLGFLSLKSVLALVEAPLLVFDLTPRLLEFLFDLAAKAQGFFLGLQLEFAFLGLKRGALLIGLQLKVFSFLLNGPLQCPGASRVDRNGCDGRSCA